MNESKQFTPWLAYLTELSEFLTTLP